MPSFRTGSLSTPRRPAAFGALGASLALALALTAVGCARDVIPNTDVEDNAENREVVQFVERYRHAMEERDVAGLLALVSGRYYDDNGTPIGTDDMDVDGLREKLAAFHDRVLAVRYEIRYRRVTFAQEHVLVDYTYTGSFRMSTPEGERWSRRLADNRIVLAREHGELKIVSGL